jgi:hypothetical protein
MLKQLEEKLEALARQRALSMLDEDYRVVAAALKGFWDRIGAQYPNKMGNYSIANILEGPARDIKTIMDYVSGEKDIDTRTSTGVVLRQNECLKGIGNYYLDKATDQIMAETFPDHERKYTEPEVGQDFDPEGTYELTVRVITMSRGRGRKLFDIYALLNGIVVLPDASSQTTVKIDKDVALRAFPFIRRTSWSMVDNWTYYHCVWQVEQFMFWLRLISPEPRRIDPSHIKTQMEEDVRARYSGMDSEERQNAVIDLMAEEIVRLRGLAFID